MSVVGQLLMWLEGDFFHQITMSVVGQLLIWLEGDFFHQTTMSVVGQLLMWLEGDFFHQTTILLLERQLGSSNIKSVLTYCMSDRFFFLGRWGRGRGEVVASF